MTAALVQLGQRLLDARETDVQRFVKASPTELKLAATGEKMRKWAQAKAIRRRTQCSIDELFARGEL